MVLQNGINLTHIHINHTVLNAISIVVKCKILCSTFSEGLVLRRATMLQPRKKPLHTYHWKYLLNEGIITEDEFQAATFTQHYRTVSEFRKPFDDQNSEVFKSGLRLKSCTTRLTECPYNKNYKENIKTMTKSDYAENLIPTLRSWSETVFRTALTGRKEKDIDKIVNKFYNSYQDEIAMNPEDHAMDYIHIIMDIAKI